MSHVVECKMVLKSVDLIEKAVLRLGGVFHRGNAKARMYASGFVDDSYGWKDFFEPEEAARIAAMPKHERIKIINAAMSNFAHTFTFDNANYDVGVVAKKDGTFRLRYDEWGSGGLTPHMGPGAGRFMQAYGIEAAKKAAKARGYATKEVKAKDGKVQLEVMVH